MLRLIGFRLAAAAGLLLALSVIVFGLLYLAPGDLESTLIGNRRVTEEARAAIRAAYHLDDPVPAQYWAWLSGVFQGDLGTSVRTNSPVTTVIGERLGYTVLLAVLAALVAVVVAVPTGVLAARRFGRFSDRALVSASVVGVSAPTFAVGLLLLYVFGYALDWFPIYGIGEGFGDVVWHLTLPAICLAIGLAAMTLKITRSAVLKELGEDYLTFARARGVRRSRITAMYLANAAGPVLTSIGLTLAYLVGGAVLIETTFGLPGLGSLLVDSIEYNDVPVVQAVTLLVAAAIAVVTLLVDLLHMAMDPRLRRAKVAR